MSEWPKISIVVPSYNQAQFLGQALASIVGQRYPRLQLMVMDGGSSDGSVEIIRAHEAQIDYWQSKPDGGQAAAINAAMERTDGDIVHWLNSDDFLEEDALWIVAKAVNSHPGCGMYIGNGFRFAERTQTRKPFTSRSLGFHREALKHGLDYIQQPSSFFSRAAWQSVGGLDLSLRFGFDWDLLIRIADRYPVTLINEFLSCSREYESTKTASGGIARALELCEIGRRHTSTPLTVGTLVYLLETLHGSAMDPRAGPVRPLIAVAEQEAFRSLISVAGQADGFPVQVDSGDFVFLPLAGAKPRGFASIEVPGLPVISIVTPSFNQAEFLARALDSVAAQLYPRLEHIVVDGGSTDASVSILRQRSGQLFHWESEKDDGPAHAINKGLARATGEVLSWLNSDDMLADRALDIVGRVFRDHPEVDVVFANAMYIDERDSPIIMDHGTYKTALYYGRIQPQLRIPAYWSYVHAVPQPTVFFRRRILERAGPLDQSYSFIFDFELFYRFGFTANVLKIERTLAFYRIHRYGKTSEWSNFLVELYRFSRPLWPSWRDPQFRRTRGEFVQAFMRREWPLAQDTRFKRVLFWLARKALAACVTLNLANPEALVHPQRRCRPGQPPMASIRRGAGVEHPVTVPDGLDERADAVRRDELEVQRRRDAARCTAIFCGFFLPQYPGISGGEIRDFHLLRHLLNFCRLSFVASHPNVDSERSDLLSPMLDSVWRPAEIASKFPNYVRQDAVAQMQTRSRQILDFLRRNGLPVLGPKLPRDISYEGKIASAYLSGFVQAKLEEAGTDFLFVSPQTNPLGLFLARERFSTRMILATYDVEAVRFPRLAESYKGLNRVAAVLEARRACAFERRNLSAYDGVIVVSERDRSILINDMGIDGERVVSIENGVDTTHFAFRARRGDELEAVLFLGSLGYRPNHLAAMRLVNEIMPLVWKVVPQAQVWIVGQQPHPDLLRRADGRRIFVTGKVARVLPYLDRCRVVCVPLTVGSGTKYKILEALSAGAPVVSSPLGLEGLDLNAEHVVLGETDAELAEAVIRTLRDPRSAALRSKRARALIEKSYAWDVILPKLEPWLDGIAKLPRRT